MEPITNKSLGYWTFDRCKEEALKYDTRIEFQKGSNGAYNACKRNGWIDGVCGHMKGIPQKPKGYWTYERCKEEALKYKSKIEFQKGSVAYSICHKKGWLDDVCGHMESDRLIDVVYMWNTVERPDVWKIGVSNHYMVETRIESVSNTLEETLHEVFWNRVSVNPYQLENTILQMGEPVTVANTICGHTEFRYISKENLKKAKKMIESA